jgi:hypothetical protein
MAIYAYAGELFDPATFTIELMPNVRKDIAIMLHFDKTTHECKAYRVPIDIGWWGARLAREVREWRKMDCLIAPLVSLGSWTPKPAAQEVVSDNGHSATDSVAAEAVRDDTSSLDSSKTVAATVTIASTFSEDDEMRYVQAVVKQSDGKLAVGTQVPRLPNGEPAIDPTAEAMELSETWLSTHKTKPELQQLCLSVGIKDVAHHRAWLAKEYVGARNALDGAKRSDVYGQESTREEIEVVHEDAVQQEVLRDPTVEILNKIELAESKQDLQRIYAEATEDGKYPERWPAEATKAGLDRIQVIENMRPVGADSPFA